MKAFVLFAPLALLGALRSFAAAPEITREFWPAVLHSREDDHRSIGARFDYAVTGDITVDTLTAEYFVRTAGAVAWESDANPENIAVETGASLRWLLHTGAPSQSSPINLGARFDPNAPNTVASAPPSRRPVMLKGDLKIGFETDQPLDNNQLTFGPRLRLTHTQNAGLWPLLPSVHLAYQRVKVLAATFLEQNGISQRTFWRFDASAAWKWRPFERSGNELAALTPIGLHLDVRYFQSFDLPSKARALGQEENIYTAGSVSYETPAWKYVSSLYVTIAHGRLPPSTREDTTIYAGFSIRQ